MGEGGERRGSEGERREVWERGERRGSEGERREMRERGGEEREIKKGWKTRLHKEK